MSYTPKIPQAVSLASPGLADLCSRRAALTARLNKGRDAVRAKEDAGDTGPEYQRWLDGLLWLESQYCAVCDQIADLDGPACDHAPCKSEMCAECKAQTVKPAPTPAPAAPPAPPAWPVDRQLALFAQTSSYGRGV
jgi:hypothetical protein